MGYSEIKIDWGLAGKQVWVLRPKGELSLRDLKANCPKGVCSVLTVERCHVRGGTGLVDHMCWTTGG